MSDRAGITIEILTQNNADFYRLLGPWLANRQVITELGHVPYDDKNKTWIVAVNESRVVGFVAAVQKINYVEYCSEFVEPSNRGIGIYSQLFFKRDSLYSGQEIRSMVTAQSLPMYLQNGFRVIKKLKRYCKVCRDPIEIQGLDLLKASKQHMQNCEDTNEKNIS